MRAVMTILMFLSLSPDLGAGSFVLLPEDTLDLNVGSFRGVSFSLQEHEAVDAEMTGSLSISPDTASVELLVMHQDDYVRWTAGLSPVDTLAVARVGSGSFRLALPRFGYLMLVISNRGNLSPVRIGCHLDVTFRGPRAPADPLPAALKALLLMMTVAVIATVAGGVIVKEISIRRRRS
jgi:hypothetical protein